MKFQDVWMVDPQDFSKGRGGFQGGYFTLKGVTDRDHASLEDACAAIERCGRGRWVRLKHGNAGADATFQYRDGRPKWLLVSSIPRPVDERPHVPGACWPRCAACALRGAI